MLVSIASHQSTDPCLMYSRYTRPYYLFTYNHNAWGKNSILRLNLVNVCIDFLSITAVQLLGSLTYFLSFQVDHSLSKHPHKANWRHNKHMTVTLSVLPNVTFRVSSAQYIHIKVYMMVYRSIQVWL